MKKILSFFIEAVFWFQFFITPLIVCALIGVFIYIKNERLLWLSITLTFLGAIGGVIYAERVRRRHGTSRYAARISATPDIWPDQYPEEIEAREKRARNERSKKERKKTR